MAGEPCRSAQSLEVLNAYDHNPAGRTWLAGEAEPERAVGSAVAAAGPMRRLAAYERANILRAASATIEARGADIADTLARETAKPIRDALPRPTCRTAA